MTKILPARGRKALVYSPLLVAMAGLLSACSSRADGTDDAASAMGVGNGKGRNGKIAVVSPSPSPTPPPTPAAVLPAGSYDGSVGVSVDSAGFADLPLRSGAHRLLVNSSSG